MYACLHVYYYHSKVTRLSENNCAKLAMLQDEKLHNIYVYMYMCMCMCMHTYISGRSAVFPCHGDT